MVVTLHLVRPSVQVVFLANGRVLPHCPPDGSRSESVVSQHGSVIMSAFLFLARHLVPHGEGGVFELKFKWARRMIGLFQNHEAVQTGQPES